MNTSELIPVPSGSNPNETHYIRDEGAYGYSCSCRGFFFHNIVKQNPEFKCRHLREYLTEKEVVLA